MSQKLTEVIAFQGAPGAFSEEAARRLVGAKIRTRPCERFEDVFRSLQNGPATGAIVPIENTLAGSVHENYDHLQRFGLTIVAETSVRIVHNLIAPQGIRFSAVRRVFSHPVALNQCLDFFARNPQLERVPFYDTAGSVKMVTEQRLEDAAGIASSIAAEIYDARILRRSIESDRRNFTRFFLLRKPAWARKHPVHPPAGTPWKTSLVFSIHNIPGALFRTLSVFALRDLNLTKIESRPLRGRPWEYLFYVDFLGELKSTPVQNALRHLGELADYIRVLGCYPKGE